MLTLEIKDKQLITSEEFKVQIDEQNPATNFDEISGSKALGIDLPINDTNRLLLKNPERFEKMGDVDDRRFEETVLRHFGQIIQKGTLVIDGANKTYSGWLRDIVGNLAERVSGKYINQSTLAGEKTFVNKTTFSPDTDDYACPKIFNRHFWRDRGSRTLKTIETTDLEGNPYNTEEEQGQLTWQFYTNEEFFVNFPTAEGVKTDGIDTAPVVSPMLFLWRAIELILSDSFIFVKENFLKDDASLKKLIIYNNYNIVKQGFSFTPKFFSSANYFLNAFNTGIYDKITATSCSVNQFNYSDLLPKISLGKSILSTQNLLNVIFSFNDLNECRIVDRQKLLTEPAYNIDEFMTGEWELGERKDVAIKLSMEHDKNDAAFMDNYQDLSDIREYIKEPVQQRTDLDALIPEMDEIHLVTGENSYYQYHWFVMVTTDNHMNETEADVLGWEPISTGFQPYFYNDGDKEVEEIKSDFSTCRQSENGYPLVMQKGNVELFKTQHEEFSPRLLFYLGDETSSYRDSSLSLDYAEETGLAAKRWNYWLPFWANRLPATAIFKFPASVFYYIKNNKAILPLRTRHGSFIIDKIEAIANKADTIETKLHVFKRESVVGFESGSVPGDGDGTASTFDPIYLGVTTYGKPYLVNTEGDVRNPPAWGTLSPAAYARSTCIDYDAVNKLLFVGGYSGMLYITDLSDVDDIQMKGIKVFASGNVSAVRYVNGLILIAKDASDIVYQQPHHTDIATYLDYEATATGILSGGYTARDFLYVGGTYYACTQAGEIFKSTNLAGNWSEVMDRSANFTHLVETENYLWVLENDDRNFRAAKSSPDNWQEFDIEITDEPEIIEAIGLSGDRVLCITNDEYSQSARLVVDVLNRNNVFAPPLAKKCGGAAAVNDKPVIAIQESSGATKLALYTGMSPGYWQYINVPAFFGKLFEY